MAACGNCRGESCTNEALKLVTDDVEDEIDNERNIFGILSDF